MASYKQAIEWMAVNDDTEWTKDEAPALSVTAALTADLFRKDDQTVTADLRKFLAKSAKKATAP